jgi:hypothetical protein
MTTFAYHVKGALFDKLVAAEPAAFPGIQILYAWGDEPAQLECIYGGGVRFEHVAKVAEGVGLAVAETVLMAWYVRVVVRPSSSVREVDLRAAEIGAGIGAVLFANPNLGGFRFTEFAGGLGDYHRTENETVTTMAYQVRAVTNLAYGVDS